MGVVLKDDRILIPFKTGGTVMVSEAIGWDYNELEVTEFSLDVGI